jgi:hypothetical protein
MINILVLADMRVIETIVTGQEGTIVTETTMIVKEETTPLITSQVQTRNMIITVGKEMIGTIVVGQIGIKAESVVMDVEDMTDPLINESALCTRHAQC